MLGGWWHAQICLSNCYSPIELWDLSPLGCHNHAVKGCSLCRFHMPSGFSKAMDSVVGWASHWLQKGSTKMPCVWTPVSFSTTATDSLVGACTLDLGCKWQPQPGDRGGYSYPHPQILAREQNSRTIYIHPHKPGSGGALQSPILSSFSKCCCHKVVGGCQIWANPYVLAGFVENTRIVSSRALSPENISNVSHPSSQCTQMNKWIFLTKNLGTFQTAPSSTPGLRTSRTTCEPSHREISVSYIVLWDPWMSAPLTLQARCSGRLILKV